MTPQRIQRQRTKGWRMPEGAIYVGRGSDWGNPFKLHPSVRQDRSAIETSVALFRDWAIEVGGVWLMRLRGHDLACWCPLCEAHRDGLPLGVACPDCAPCHADVLLELANQEEDR